MDCIYVKAREMKKLHHKRFILLYMGQLLHNLLCKS